MSITDRNDSSKKRRKLPHEITEFKWIKEKQTGYAQQLKENSYSKTKRILNSNYTLYKKDLRKYKKFLLDTNAEGAEALRIGREGLDSNDFRGVLDTRYLRAAVQAVVTAKDLDPVVADLVYQKLKLYNQMMGFTNETIRKAAIQDYLKRKGGEKKANKDNNSAKGAWFGPIKTLASSYSYIKEGASLELRAARLGKISQEFQGIQSRYKKFVSLCEGKLESALQLLIEDMVDRELLRSENDPNKTNAQQDLLVNMEIHDAQKIENRLKIADRMYFAVDLLMLGLAVSAIVVFGVGLAFPPIAAGVTVALFAAGLATKVLSSCIRWRKGEKLNPEKNRAEKQLKTTIKNRSYDLNFTRNITHERQADQSNRPPQRTDLERKTTGIEFTRTKSRRQMTS